MSGVVLFAPGLSGPPHPPGWEWRPRPRCPHTRPGSFSLFAFGLCRSDRWQRLRL